MRAFGKTVEMNVPILGSYINYSAGGEDAEYNLLYLGIMCPKHVPIRAS
jgi:hypothetical protein